MLYNDPIGASFILEDHDCSLKIVSVTGDRGKSTVRGGHDDY